jgi:hypothetical protein
MIGPSGIFSILANSSVEIGTTGYDFAGFVDAQAATKGLLNSGYCRTFYKIRRSYL